MFTHQNTFPLFLITCGVCVGSTISGNSIYLSITPSAEEIKQSTSKDISSQDQIMNGWRWL